MSQTHSKLCSFAFNNLAEMTSVIFLLTGPLKDTKCGQFECQMHLIKAITLSDHQSQEHRLRKAQRTKIGTDEVLRTLKLPYYLCHAEFSPIIMKLSLPSLVCQLLNTLQMHKPEQQLCDTEMTLCYLNFLLQLIWISKNCQETLMVFY